MAMQSDTSVAAKINLTVMFIESARGLGATVDIARKDPDDLNRVLQKLTAGEEAVLFAEPDRVSPAMFEVFLEDKRVITRPTKEQLATVTAGVTDAFCAVASTGSVCVSVSKNLGSPVSLLTRKHIAVVDSATIVSRPRDLFGDGGTDPGGLRRSFSFITGPSATADMGPLVIGVHGPGKLHIVVLE